MFRDLRRMLIPLVVLCFVAAGCCHGHRRHTHVQGHHHHHEPPTAHPLLVLDHEER